MKTAYPLTINFSENCVQFLPVPCFICQSKMDGCRFNVIIHFNDLIIIKLKCTR